MDYSRARECDNSQGGSELIYILPFVKYTQSEITVVSNYLIAFPATTIYQIGTNNISFDEDVSEFYEQKLGFQINRILDTDIFKNLANIDFRFILKDNNNNLRMLGLFTGMQGKFTKTTGTNRADFNGYNFTYDTKEENTAPFLTDLSAFSIEHNLQELLQYEI